MNWRHAGLADGNEIPDMRLGQDLYYRWEWKFQANPQQLWPFVADTNRFDRDTGVPAYTEDQTASEQNLPKEALSARRRLRIHLYGVPLEWIEEPFEWIQPYRFGVVRRYEPGPLPWLQPLGRLRVLVQLEAQPEGGTHLTYEVWAQPRNLLGFLAIPVQIGFLYTRHFERVLRTYDRLAVTRQSLLDLPGNEIRFPMGGRERLDVLHRTLYAQGTQPVLVDRLIALIEQADDLTLTRLRPYALADHWGAPRRAVLELCLLATRAGLLSLQWDLLCPVCRVAKDRRV